MNTSLCSGYYTGVGSRETPINIQQLMTEIAMRLNMEGWTLRTGTGSRANTAFQVAAGEGADVYFPWNNFNQGEIGTVSSSKASSNLAKEVWEFRMVRHLVSTDGSTSRDWDTLHPSNQAILAKSMCMLLGRNLSVPSDMLICWTPSAKLIGMTAHIICLAALKHIPVFNLADYETEVVMKEMLRNKLSPNQMIENRRQRCESEKAICGISWG